MHTGYGSEDERDRLLEAATVFDWLRLDTGKRVAVIGAGPGYYTIRAANRLGASAGVWAVEVRPELLERLRNRVERAGLVTVTLVQGEPNDPLLPPSSVDIVIVDHVYHEIPNPFAYFHRLASALAAGAVVGVVEQDGPILSHAAPASLVRCELEAVGYQVDNEIPLAGGAYLLVLRQGAELPEPEDIEGSEC